MRRRARIAALEAELARATQTIRYNGHRRRAFEDELERVTEAHANELVRARHWQKLAESAQAELAEVRADGRGAYVKAWEQRAERAEAELLRMRQRAAALYAAFLREADSWCPECWAQVDPQAPHRPGCSSEAAA